jgi:histone H3/H4
MDGNQGPSAQSYRQCLKISVGALLVENGFDTADKLALETITELAQSFLKELGRSSRAFCELACRTEVLGADVLLALSEMGHPPIGFREYGLRVGRKTVGAPSGAALPKQTSILHTGDRKRPPRYF